ncbi:uncharacterized protein LOC119673801 isoform X2 [Teleopsis dalmanni]|uniref:uncharacterized protein LOC119673801 isoform X2 n=1 Tax=Teleopsis dalmanni TaxID=139649 RepID=UPI0018CE499A|nr:uncharacterized protein LOC119673801 isoform X2 [Teleopsis dalmanni]
MNLELTSTENSDEDLVEEEEEDEVDSCSSFSLQECINEFRARRIRRISSHSRDVQNENPTTQVTSNVTSLNNKKNNKDIDDADLIKQNRSNREQERKCKPCKNGFCYCFTSDSGDGSCTGLGTARGTHVRQHRRHKNEQIQVAQQHNKKHKEKQNDNLSHRRVVDDLQIPNTVRSNTSGEFLTAFSRLETTTNDEPLIHIIQELHNNCVISEVRVNKEKALTQGSYSQPESKKITLKGEVNKTSPVKEWCKPTAPPLEKITENDSISDTSTYVSALDKTIKCDECTHRKHKAAGRLLQKRLSATSGQIKPRNIKEPPPKPPRSSIGFEHKDSVSSLVSTSPSVREAELIVDKFLVSRGVKINTSPAKLRNKDTSRKSGNDLPHKSVSKSDKRKSYPLTIAEEKPQRKPLFTYPNLSDLELGDDIKELKNQKNLRRYASEKPLAKEITVGWHQPKIAEMLNYDAASKPKQFRSQGTQAEPQVIGWQIPPKMQIDMVDGGVCHNLAANIETKSTPVKTRIFNNKDKSFPWSKQLRNFSPWPVKNKRKNSTPRSKRSKTASFLCNSKKKILRLVSPKKDNNIPNRIRRQQTPHRTIGVQTTGSDIQLYEPSLIRQSPPGSYHSPIQTSPQSTTPTRSSDANVEQFDFSRTIQSPPKAKSRLQPTQRKLHFPTGCGRVMCIKSCCKSSIIESIDEQRLSNLHNKTYQSYQTDLDNDVNISKMSYILGNIRAKLEASDEFAVRTFQEVERREHQHDNGFDCVDGHNSNISRHGLRLHNLNHRLENIDRQDPLYSEIEEERMHISGSPDFDNKTGLETKTTEKNFDHLYAKVNKAAKNKKNQSTTTSTTTTTLTPLGKILHESLKSKNSTLPPLYESTSLDVSYTSPTPDSVSTELPPLPQSPKGNKNALSHSSSLNNIMEQHSLPKNNRNLSKSDLSIYRSEIFLDNLCHAEVECLEKVENSDLDRTYVSLPGCDSYDAQPIDTISYEMPNEDETHSNTAGSHLGLSLTSPPQRRDQSTPKKNHNNGSYGGPQPRTFITKLIDEENRDRRKQLDISIDCVSVDQPDIQNHSSSCPVTPHKVSATPNEARCIHSASLNEISNYDNVNKNSLNSNTRNELSINGGTRYKRLKNALRQSLRKSKNFVRKETKRLSLSLLTTPGGELNDPEKYLSMTSLNLDRLFCFGDDVPLAQQIATAVSICRQTPGFEVSAEMVEAERLLLYSTLCADMEKQRLNLVQIRGLEYGRSEEYTRRFFVDGMRFPIKPDVCYDLTFNYFYIVTFECAGVIRSTQSVECVNHEAVFRDCGIEFFCMDTDAVGMEPVISCKIYMLRLRKISTLSIDTRKSVKMTNVKNSSPPSSSSSDDGVFSRFCLHAEFKLKPIDFIPYTCVESETKKSDKVYLRTANNYCVPIRFCSKSTNLVKEIELSARTEIRFPKRKKEGFLNVQDPYTLHNWNQRWVTLNGLHIYIWQDENSVDSQPLFSLDLRHSKQTAPVLSSPPELCARPRSFCLQCDVFKSEENHDTAGVFFAAETLLDLNAWLDAVNIVLDFITKWL